MAVNLIFYFLFGKFFLLFFFLFWLLLFHLFHILFYIFFPARVRSQGWSQKWSHIISVVSILRKWPVMGRWSRSHRASSMAKDSILSKTDISLRKVWRHSHLIKGCGVTRGTIHVAMATISPHPRRNGVNMYCPSIWVVNQLKKVKEGGGIVTMWDYVAMVIIRLITSCEGGRSRIRPG